MRLHFMTFGTVVLLLSAAWPALAQNNRYTDPSARVARLNDVRGELSYSPAGEDQWLSAVRNRPLIRGDRLWADKDTQAEIQIGGSMLRLGSETAIELLDIDDQVAQIQLSQGSVIVSVRQMYDRELIEVATPVLAFTIREAGRYRIDVDPYDDATTVSVWDGGGVAFGDGDSRWVEEGETIKFFSDDLRDFARYRLPRQDQFDRYSDGRDRILDRSPTLRYVGYDVVGYSDLDQYGSWQSASSYGNVWFPTRVARGWAPYSDGHWVWQDPWGWTWVDNAPWGFAPSHYGRWVFVSNRWGWLPGPRTSRAVYAPALVAFVGGNNWSVSLSFGDRSPVGWFPLGPRDVYVPSYRASRGYFGRVNQNNTIINTTIINNYYTSYSRGDSSIDNFNYAYRRQNGALTAVSRDTFVNARSVRGAQLRVDSNAYSTGQALRFAAVAPSVRSVMGAAEVSSVRPGRESFNRSVLARHAPPPAVTPFARREAQLSKNPGRPLDTVDASGRVNNARAQALPQQVRQITAPERARTDRSDTRQSAPVTALPQFDRSDVANQRSRDQRPGRDNNAVRGQQQPAVSEPVITQPKPGRQQRMPETTTQTPPATVPTEDNRTQRQRQTREALIRQQAEVDARHAAEQQQAQELQQRTEQERQQRESQNNRAAQQQQAAQVREQEKQSAELLRAQRQQQVEQARAEQQQQQIQQQQQRQQAQEAQQQQQNQLLQQRQRTVEAEQQQAPSRDEALQRGRAERKERVRGKADDEDEGNVDADESEDRASRRRDRQR